MDARPSASNVTTAIVLAGGQGTRLRPVVSDVPKPMAPISGRPFLEPQLDYWIEQGVQEFILSVGYMHEKISAHFGPRYRDCAVRYAVEQTPLGTGGGLLLAAAAAAPETERFLVVNGDTFFEVALAELASFHTQCRADWTIALFGTTDTARYMGVEVDEQGTICAMGVRRADARRVLANGGVYLVERAGLGRAPYEPGTRVSLEDELLASLRDAGGRVCGREFAGSFIDIGVPGDYLRAPGIIGPTHARKATA
jgi:D-glycero-alpha-D-manno-heptose 1-phosphate guanylyltransferase